MADDGQAASLRSLWTEVGGARLHARVSADASRARDERPTVVLVHGLVISSLYMIPTAERLAPFCRVYAPDLPGFGLSSEAPPALSVPEMADALDLWAASAGISRAVFVGNSLGCQVIVDLAARRPELIAGVVLAGPTVDRHARTASAQFKRWLVDWTRESPSLMPAHVRDYYRAGVRRALAAFRHALADRIELKLPHVSAPALVVRGGRDPIVPQAWAEEVAGLLPRARCAVIHGAPHAVNYSAHAPFAALVREFVGHAHL